MNPYIISVRIRIVDETAYDAQTGLRKLLFELFGKEDVEIVGTAEEVVARFKEPAGSLRKAPQTHLA